MNFDTPLTFRLIEIIKKEPGQTILQIGRNLKVAAVPKHLIYTELARMNNSHLVQFENKIFPVAWNPYEIQKFLSEKEEQTKKSEESKRMMTAGALAQVKSDISYDPSDSVGTRILRYMATVKSASSREVGFQVGVSMHRASSALKFLSDRGHLDRSPHPQRPGVFLYRLNDLKQGDDKPSEDKPKTQIHSKDSIVSELEDLAAAIDQLSKTSAVLNKRLKVILSSLSKKSKSKPSVQHKL